MCFRSFFRISDLPLLLSLPGILPTLSTPSKSTPGEPYTSLKSFCLSFDWKPRRRSSTLRPTSRRPRLLCKICFSLYFNLHVVSLSLVYAHLLFLSCSDLGAPGILVNCEFLLHRDSVRRRVAFSLILLHTCCCSLLQTESPRRQLITSSDDSPKS